MHPPRFDPRAAASLISPILGLVPVTECFVSKIIETQIAVYRLPYEGMSHVRIGEGIISGPSYPANVVRLRGQATSTSTSTGTKQCGDRRRLHARGNDSSEIRKREFLRRQFESGRQSDPGATRLPATPAQRSAEILSISGPHRNAFQKYGVPYARGDQRD